MDCGDCSCVGEPAVERARDPPGSCESAAATALPARAPAGKPWLGGLSRQTGREYHHAASQTEISPERQAAQAAAVSAATQTAPRVRSHAAQSKADAATQVPRPGWFQDHSDGRVVEPAADHQSAAQVLEQRHAAALTIQRVWRGAAGRAAAARAAEDAVEATAAALAEQEAARQVAQQAAEYEVRRRMQPRRPSDFELLYDELGQWWSQETSKIRAAAEGGGLSEGEAAAAGAALLAKETRLLQTIDKLKLRAAAPNRAERVGRMLVQLAAPRRWELPGGAGVLEVETPATRRGAELGDAYRALLARVTLAPGEGGAGGLDARLAALLAAKFYCKEFDCSLAREVVQLVDREADLIARGRHPDTMAGLRQRIANRFLALITDPGFNPAAGQPRQEARAVATAAGGAGGAAATAQS